MASEHVVYKDSPLGEYLKAAGEDVATATEQAVDWDHPAPEPSATFAPFATSRLKHATISNSSSPSCAGKAKRQTATFHGSNTELKPLVLGNEKSRRKLRFQFLFAAPLKRRLGPRENASFLERFRYVLVTSQLLDENVSVASFVRADEQHESNLHKDFLDGTPSTRRGGTGSDLGTGTRHWIGSGGCVIVVAVLFAWFLRGGDRLISGIGTKCKLLVGMVIVLSVSLFLYAHAWRRRLRTTRQSAIECATQFIKSNHLFDINMSRTIGIVQEVEFISRGFGFTVMSPSPSASPVRRASSRKSGSHSTRLQQKSPIGLQRCKALRNQISSALNLSLALYTRSLNGLSELCNHSDLEKYFEIYDINNNPTAMQLRKEDHQREKENPAVIDNGEDEENDDSASIESLWQLKQQFRRLHHTRRKLLCCLLAMDAQGDRSDISKWRSVVQDIRTLSDLMTQLSDDLGKSLIQGDITELVEFYTREQEKTYPHKSGPSSQLPVQVRWRPHMQALNAMSATLRNIEAKMYVLREDSAKLERQGLRLSTLTPNGSPDRSIVDMDSFLIRSGYCLGPTMESPLGESTMQMSSDLLVKQYNNIGADLKVLVKEWESGKRKLYEAIASGESFAQTSSLDRQYEVENDSSAVSSVMSSPDSLTSGTTFDSTAIPWSLQSVDDARFIMRHLEDDEAEGDGIELLLENDSAGIPMAAKSKIVENIASAMIRQQDRMLKSL
ncbi:Mysoin-binding motif of peroxisomes-domain-containing protein [Lipomyces kononenkoae]|uniref:Mysoin-binding motif of peroxisomes-domain-containing protein n=1 Tax=Lipomyces kononenkoae TaxID=34357 RepID=A0ACC3T5N3_LIPKO